MQYQVLFSKRLAIIDKLLTISNAISGYIYQEVNIVIVIMFYILHRSIQEKTMQISRFT